MAINFPEGTQNFPSKILQVQSVTKTDRYSATSNNSSQQITGLAVSITPQSSSNKVFIMYTVHTAVGGSYGGQAIRLVRNNNTFICAPTSYGNRNTGTSKCIGSAPNREYPFPTNQHFLDSPNTTSSTTYSLHHFDPSGYNSIVVNGNMNDSNDLGYGRFTSSITVMEIEA